MRAKLLKILRRDAEKSIKGRLCHSWRFVEFNIYKNKRLVWRQIMSHSSEEWLRCLGKSVLYDHRRDYILEKLSKLK